MGGEDQLKAIIRQGFALQNTADKAVLQVDQVLAQAMGNIKQLVGSLPEESLLRGRAWRDLEPLVRQELNIYGQQLGGAIENALVDAEPDMERAAIRQAKLGGADFGPETISINPSGGRVQASVERALNSRVNDVAVKRLFNLDGKTAGAPIDQALFRTVDTRVRKGMIQGWPTQDIADLMATDVISRGVPGVNLNAEAARTIRSQSMAIARTATQDMARQVKTEVYDANADAMEGMEWQWTTALDSRTCEVCGVLDGKREKEQKALPDWPLHPNCRCQSVPIDPEDPFWNNSEVTAQVISDVPFKFNGKPVPSLRGAEREAARKAGYYQSKVKVKGKTYYRKAETVKAGEPPTGYSDVLAKWAKEPTAPGHETSLVQAMGGGPIGEKRANWFKKQYSPKKDPQQILQAMLTGKAGAQKFIPIEKLLAKQVKLPVKKVVKKAAPKPKVVVKPAAPQQTDQDYIQAHQFDNGKNKLSHQNIADSLEVAAQQPGLAGQNMRQMMEFQRKKEIQTVWSNGREKAFNAKNDDFAHWKNPDVIKALRHGHNGPNKQLMEKAADNLEQGIMSPTMDVLGRVKGAGHAPHSTNLIAMKQEAQFKAITKDNFIHVKRVAKFSVEDAASKKPSFTTGQGLYKRSGKTSMKTELGWINTYVHEMGHQVHFKAGMPHIDTYVKEAMSGKKLSKLEAGLERNALRWKPSKYGTTNEMERFAETFTQYVFAPDELKKASPVAYKWVEDAMKEALK